MVYTLFNIIEVRQNMHKKLIYIIYFLLCILFLVIALIVFSFFKKTLTEKNIEETLLPIKEAQKYDVMIDIDGKFSAYYSGSYDPEINKLFLKNVYTSQFFETYDLYFAFYNYLEGISILDVDEISFDLNMRKFHENYEGFAQLFPYQDDFSCNLITNSFKISEIECENATDFFFILFIDK